MNQNKSKVSRLVTNSMLAAMCAVLGAVSIDLGNIKITLESIPIILGALLFGPADGAIIGFIGTLVYQLLKYGLSVTTLLWMLPYVVCGFMVGYYAKKKNFSLSLVQTIVLVVIAELVVTTLNTGVMYIDSKIYGYYSYAYIFGATVIRYVICVGKAIVTGAVMPSLTAVCRKAINSSGRVKEV